MKILHQDASEGAYKFFCVWIFGLWFGYILFDPLMSLALYPKSLYFPAGFLLKFLPPSIYYLPISYPFLFFLKMSMLLSIAAVLLGCWKKWSGVFACLLLTVYQGIVRSFGHINHPELLLLFSAYVLTIFFFFEDSISPFPNPPHKGEGIHVSKYGIPLIAVLFFVCFSYSFAGIHRMVARGIDIYNTNTIIYWIITEGKRSRLVNWHMEDLMLTNAVASTMMKMGFPIITFFEITAPICMISRRFRYLWLLMMVPFHLMVWVFMGIMFWANLALYILFFNFDTLFKTEKT
jgi:hypothetical protein